MEDFQVPSYYTVKSDVTEEELSSILHALEITPILAVIITDNHDLELAQKFGKEVLRTNTFKEATETAFELSTRMGQPVLVIGNSATFQPCYSEGPDWVETR